MKGPRARSHASNRSPGRRTFRYHVPVIRRLGFPPHVEILAVLRDDALLKAHPAYRAAKGGDGDAAAALIVQLGIKLLNHVRESFDSGLIFVAPHAQEAQGDNAIPQVLATALSLFADGEVDYEIVQVTKVYHTGADPMERLNARPRFRGNVRAGERYVLVDDVTTMGGTLAELAHFIQARSGIVHGVVVLVNASRSGMLQPTKKVVRLLTERFGHEITEICGIEPGALTADEANYLVGFRTADEIRNRKAAAAKETTRRLRSKGIYGLGQPEKLAAFNSAFAAHFRRAFWRQYRRKRIRHRNGKPLRLRCN
ncbi:phosphoribosyltransferase [Ralstonia solanacearum]|uniref:Phosphoribosyltransferase n=1 Tax=Ralstonia solanacearum TaxID=305 RepID=A0AAE3NLK2_RALSL|nr:phosphoribosyltransferase [Ralstonia solanacearum]MBB6581677.1 phosphoribosyltransferase [Ralstonia solanacearum]MDB0523743.1 phosphoribosyltransferase [Ralstonia solanacearum]